MKDVSDHTNDVSSIFTLDDVLTWVSAYWFGGCIGTSFAPYALETVMPNDYVDVPVVMSIFPKDLANAPHSFARRLFDVSSYQELPVGGRFAAWERPDEYLAGVQAAVMVARLPRSDR